MECVIVSPGMYSTFGNGENNFDSIDTQLERAMEKYHRSELSMLEEVLDKFDVEKVSVCDMNSTGGASEERTEVPVSSWMKQILPSPAPFSRLSFNSGSKRKSKSSNSLRGVRKSLSKQSSKGNQPRLKQNFIDAYMQSKKFRSEVLSKK